MPKSVLVTGANRGLGLEFVRQYTADGWRVHACCRSPDGAAELGEWRTRHAGLVSVHALDVADFGAIDALAASLAGSPLDLLINNAGIYAPEPGQRDENGQSFGNMDYKFWETAFLINALAPFKLAEALVENVAASEWRRIVTISSGMGSISQTDGGYHAYRSSKAAVNMIMTGLALELRERGIRVAALSPGWVRTRMGGASARLSVEESVAGMREQIAALDGPVGGILRYDGSVVPW